MKRSIVITVTSQGEISIEAVSFKGADCEKATKYLEEALGTIQQRTRKPEYSYPANINHQQRIGT